MASRINLDRLHDALKPKLEQYAGIIFPNAKKAGKWFRVGDTNGNKGESLAFSEDGFVDHATNEKGSLIRLASLNLGLSIPAAAQHLCNVLGIVAEKDETYPEKQPGKNVTLVALSDVHKAHLQKRGISPELAIACGVQSSSDGQMAIPHYDADGRMVGIKYHSTNDRSWFSETGSANVLWPIPFVLQHFPEADTIYVTEGHWDALVAIQAGFPAVSIPNGASNLQWIEACYNFIHSFPNKVLCYDNDEAGALGLTSATNRLSVGVQVIDYPEGCKDLNDILKDKNGNLRPDGMDILKAVLAANKPFTPPNVISAHTLMAAAREPEQYIFVHNTPFGEKFPFQYRDHESTTYTAYTGEGKSNWLRQTFLGFALEDEKCFIASFEDLPITITRQLIQHMGKQMPEAEVVRILKNINLYDTTQLTSKKKKCKVKPEELIDLFEYQFKRYGYRHFLVDNLMTLAVDRQDNTAQSDAAEIFRQFSISYPIHLHLIAHPRKKPQVNAKLLPPDPSEIRGASEIADASFNIMGLVRNIPKERKMQEMIQQGLGKDTILNYDMQNPDAILHVNKQRATGILPTAWMWFDRETKTFRNNYQR